MGLLTFSINVTLDGCVDHREGIADDETHAFFTRLMDEGGAMLWGRVTYEMMESYWPAVARGEVEAPPAIREWAVKLEAKPKYVVSSTRKDLPWTNSHHLDHFQTERGALFHSENGPDSLRERFRTEMVILKMPWPTIGDPACKGSRTRLRRACCSVAAGSQPSWTGWI